VTTALEFISHLSSPFAVLLFAFWLVYRLIRASQNTALHERTAQKRKGSVIATCAAYLGLFLAASLFFTLTILLVYRVTLPE
jgi:hypothetical protein